MKQMKKPKVSAVEVAKTLIRDTIDKAVEPLGRDEYAYVLDWLGSEVRCRLDCLNEEGNE